MRASAHCSFRFRIVAAFLTACVVVLTTTHPCGAARELTQATVEGGSADSIRTRITWTDSGGDIRRSFAGGGFEETWFSKGRVVWRGLAGDTHAFSWDLPYQGARILLSGEYRNLQVAKTVSGAREQLERISIGSAGWLYIWSDPSGHILRADTPFIAFTSMTFTGDTATSWKAKSNDGLPFPDMENGRLLDVAEALPAPPISLWNRARIANDQIISASVGTHVASIRVDSAAHSLLVSPAFARTVGATIDNAGVAELHDVSISGVRVARVFAHLANDDRYDLRAGITMFPGTTIALEKSGRARLSVKGCDNSDGVSYVDADGTTILRLGRTSVIFDSAHDGPPISAEMNFDNPLLEKPCDATVGPIMFGKAKFGSDTMCYSKKMFAAEHGAGLMVVGLHSLSSQQLFIDTKKARMCWN